MNWILRLLGIEQKTEHIYIVSYIATTHNGWVMGNVVWRQKRKFIPMDRFDIEDYVKQERLEVFGEILTSVAVLSIYKV